MDKYSLSVDPTDNIIVPPNVYDGWYYVGPKDMVVWCCPGMVKGTDDIETCSHCVISRIEAILNKDSDHDPSSIFNLLCTQYPWLYKAILKDKGREYDPNQKLVIGEDLSSHAIHLTEYVKVTFFDKICALANR